MRAGPCRGGGAQVKPSQQGPIAHSESDSNLIERILLSRLVLGEPAISCREGAWRSGYCVSGRQPLAGRPARGFVCWVIGQGAWKKHAHALRTVTVGSLSSRPGRGSQRARLLWRVQLWSTCLGEVSDTEEGAHIRVESKAPLQRFTVPFRSFSVKALTFHLSSAAGRAGGQDSGR